MKRAAAALLIVLGAAPVLAQTAGMPEVPGRQMLRLDGVPPPGGLIWIELRTGPLPRGTVLHLATPAGEWSTALVPFGTQSWQGPTSYQVAIPASAAIAGHLELDAQITLPGEDPRPPRPEELTDITVLSP